MFRDLGKIVTNTSVINVERIRQFLIYSLRSRWSGSHRACTLGKFPRILGRCSENSTPFKNNVFGVS